MFYEGSIIYFFGMSLEIYDIIFSNVVFYWVLDKSEVFEKMFRSFRLGGKIVMSYFDYLLLVYEYVYGEFNLENLDKILNMFQLEIRLNVEKMCMVVGFEIVQSYDEMFVDCQYENGENLCLYFWVIIYGMFDLKFVMEDRLIWFCLCYLSGDLFVKLFKVWVEEGDFYCIIVVIKLFSM